MFNNSISMQFMDAKLQFEFNEMMNDFIPRCNYIDILPFQTHYSNYSFDNQIKIQIKQNMTYKKKKKL